MINNFNKVFGISPGKWPGKFFLKAVTCAQSVRVIVC